MYFLVRKWGTFSLISSCCSAVWLWFAVDTSTGYQKGQCRLQCCLNYKVTLQQVCSLITLCKCGHINNYLICVLACSCVIEKPLMVAWLFQMVAYQLESCSSHTAHILMGQSRNLKCIFPTMVTYQCQNIKIIILLLVLGEGL